MEGQSFDELNGADGSKKKNDDGDGSLPRTKTDASVLQTPPIDSQWRLEASPPEGVKKPSQHLPELSPAPSAAPETSETPSGYSPSSRKSSAPRSEKNFDKYYHAYPSFHWETVQVLEIHVASMGFIRNFIIFAYQFDPCQVPSILQTAEGWCLEGIERCFGVVAWQKRRGALLVRKYVIINDQAERNVPYNSLYIICFPWVSKDITACNHNGRFIIILSYFSNKTPNSWKQSAYYFIYYKFDQVLLRKETPRSSASTW